jgi:hypothetical protein
MPENLTAGRELVDVSINREIIKYLLHFRLVNTLWHSAMGFDPREERIERTQ